MVDIEKLKDEIVERLKPLDPDKVILFGSYAYGTPNEDSDIDLFLLKDKTDKHFLFLLKALNSNKGQNEDLRDLQKVSLLLKLLVVKDSWYG